MKLHRYLLLFFVFPLLLFSQNNKEYFYYYKGKKQILKIDKDYLYVSASKKVNTRFSKIQREDKNFFWEIVKIGENVSQQEYDKKVAELKKNVHIQIVLPYFRTEKGEKVGLSNFFYVKLKKLSDRIVLDILAKQNECLIVRQDKSMPLWFTLSITSKTALNTIEIANKFQQTGLFENSEPDLIIQDISVCKTDKFFNTQWALENNGQYGGKSGIDINVCKAWNISKGDKVKVAVIDHGIELNHPDLMNNIYHLSYDTETGTSPSRVLGNHGIACAGIIGAEDNSIGISGVAPDCKLISISNSLMASVNAKEKLANGINWAWQNGADVISNSWGHNNLVSDYIDDAINNALQKGRNGKGSILVFASGNNNGHIIYPANSNPDILTVGAMSPCGERKSPSSCDTEYKWGSNYGQELDVMAPGVLISTTDLRGNQGYNSNYFIHRNSGGTKLSSDFSDEDYTNCFNGTSSACPHVAGVAALILSVNPNLTGKEVRDIIEKTAQKVGGYNYQNRGDKPNGSWNNEMGYGLVDAYKAVQYAAINATDESCRNSHNTFELKVPVPTGATIRWEFSPRTGQIISGQGTKKCVFNALSSGNYLVKAIVTHNGNIKTYEKELDVLSPYKISIPVIANHPNTPSSIPCCGGSNYVPHVICTSTIGDLEWENKILYKDPKDSFTFIIKEGGVDIQATRFTSTPFIVSTRARGIPRASNPCGLTSDWSSPISRYYGSISKTSFRSVEGNTSSKIFFSEYFMHRGNSLRIIKTDIYQWLDQTYTSKDLTEKETNQIISILNNIDTYNSLNVKLFDMSGRKLFEQNFNTNEDMIVNTSQLIKGMYVIYYICGDISHGKVIYKP